MRSALPLLAIAAGVCACDPGTPAPTPGPPAQSAPSPPVESPLPATEPGPGAAKAFYVGRWAANPGLCRAGAWVFTPDGVSTAGEVSCTFGQVRDTTGGVEIDATCIAQAPPERYTLRLGYTEPTGGLRVEGGPFAEIGLIRCPQ